MNNYGMNNYGMNKAIVAFNRGNDRVDELTMKAVELARRIEKMFIKEMKRTSFDDNDLQAKNVKLSKEMARGVNEIFKEYVKKHPIKPENYMNLREKIIYYLCDVTREFYYKGLSKHSLIHMGSEVVTVCVDVRSRAKELSKQANELAHILD